MNRSPERRPAGTAAAGWRLGDEHLWQQVKTSVTPLSRASDPRRETAADSAPPPEPAPALAPNVRPTPRPLQSPLSDRAPELAHGVAPGLDRRTLIRLRRGLWPVEAELDLHGCTQEMAHHRLAAFLAAAEAEGRRCVLVITGRGLRGADTGVLREAVPRWLNQHPNRRRVLAFCYATPACGGQGALFVLVRRTRR